MKCLAWDTSSKTGTLVALEWEKDAKEWLEVQLKSEWNLDVDRVYSEKLLWGIDQILKSLHWEIEEIDLFGVGIGPGSFTGLRIGLTTARTLAHALNRPLVPVSSLASLAYPIASVMEQSAPTLIIATTDACKGELYALWGLASHVVQCQSDWKSLVKEEVLEPMNLLTQLEEGFFSHSPIPWIAVGEGRDRYPEFWSKLPLELEQRNSCLVSHQISGRALGNRVWTSYQKKLYKQGLQVEPRYLRVSNAELNLKLKSESRSTQS